jgi:U32 family peptidase
MQKTDFELLLPVGQFEMALAAIHNGADAIFVGFPGFNARGRSYDFEIAELKEIIETCHLYGVKVNLAFNIVIFQNEIEKVVAALKEVLPLKPDALIIQDLGLVRIVRAMAPEQKIHASTQMTITNDLAIELLNDLNIKRFVLGRENSLSEIKLIAERTKKELEVFVHGALCVSYSGQCFTSETLGGRSANRGQCAQSCRFSYELIVDGEKKQLIDQTYLVSPQDLCGIAEIPELMRLGVKSFKVEGRLKTPEFVASVAKSFRHAIDSVLNEKPLSLNQIEKEKTSMAVQYSRGFFPGWLNGVNHQELVNGTFSSHRGALIGKITAVQNFEITVQLNKLYDLDLKLQNGDGLLWVEKTQNKGSFIFSVQKISDDKYKLGLSNDSGITLAAVGSDLYLNHDKDQKKLF